MKKQSNEEDDFISQNNDEFIEFLKKNPKISSEVLRPKKIENKYLFKLSYYKKRHFFINSVKKIKSYINLFYKKIK
jgi:hypothetical protein